MLTKHECSEVIEYSSKHKQSEVLFSPRGGLYLKEISVAWH